MSAPTKAFGQCIINFYQMSNDIVRAGRPRPYDSLKFKRKNYSLQVFSIKNETALPDKRGANTNGICR